MISEKTFVTEDGVLLTEADLDPTAQEDDGEEPPEGFYDDLLSADEAFHAMTDPHDDVDDEPDNFEDKYGDLEDDDGVDDDDAE